MKSLGEIDDAEFSEFVRNAHGLAEMLWSTEELGAIATERQQDEPPVSKRGSKTVLNIIVRVDRKNWVVFVEPGSATAEEPRYGLVGERGSDVPDPCEGEDDWSVRGLCGDCSLDRCQRVLPSSRVARVPFRAKSVIACSTCPLCPTSATSVIM